MENPVSNEVFERELKDRLVRNYLDMVILQLIQIQPTWGYRIIKKTEAKYGMRLRHGALYPMLNSLEASGLIISRKELEKGRIRKTYEITLEGLRLLQIYNNFLKEQIVKKGAK